MGFDYFLFTGGLQQAGIATNTVQGTVRYGIQQYSDLNFLLGTRWHYRGINKYGNYAYVVISSIEFHLRKRRSVVDYHPPESPGRPIAPSKLDTGYLLTFCFQRRYGNSSTFGRNRDIFITELRILHLYMIKHTTVCNVHKTLCYSSPDLFRVGHWDRDFLPPDLFRVGNWDRDFLPHITG